MEKGEVKQKKSTLVAKWVVIGILIFGMTFSFICLFSICITVIINKR